MRVQVDHSHIVTGYVSIDKRLREKFFVGLHDWKLQSVERPSLVGDFNCVEALPLNRLGEVRSEKTESDVLLRLEKQCDMEDARVLPGSALEELELPQHENFTHWQGDSVSRLDRFYLATATST
ncbi:hypothetical protein PC116_g15082 [Phytophthora cactorum]|nr:hypothetical protein PC116_g15082 [Phytophthora cactorum]